MIPKNILWVILVLIAAYFIGRYVYMQPRYVNGEKAPIFEATTLEEKTISLSDFEGQYILLDFWGSWCGPCLQELPELKALQQKYKDKKLVILNIAVEEKEDRWRKAVKRLGMDWEYHIFDKATSLRFFDSPIAQIYGIKQVPSKFLISPTGEIIGSNISFDAIDKLLETRL